MSDLEHQPIDELSNQHDDPEEIAAAYEALDEDRRQQAMLAGTTTTATSEELEDPAISGAAEQNRPDSPGTANPEEAQPQQPATGSGRRVFVIDGREYPDPDTSLPITGTRSVQAMYRDYFPGQLENADVLQKTRSDGTLEVTFRRRIGTKGRALRSRPRHRRPTSGEVVVDSDRVVRVLAALPEDRPLAWHLLEQALGPNGAVLLDYVPPVSELNLAEAQVSSRTRLIELAVGELASLRPSL